MAEHVCPVWAGYFLANRFRKLLQNPQKILSPHVRAGMTVLDVGSAMGYFSLPMAEMVGPSGKVVCVDVQPGMLRVLRRRAAEAGLTDRIETHESTENAIGLHGRDGSFDFALAFTVLHEVGDLAGFLREIYQLLKPGASFLLTEPIKHVSRADFDRTLALAQAQGFVVAGHPQIRLSHTAAVIRRISEVTMTIPPDNLKALIFDLDDTLVVEEAAAEAALLQTCELARARYGIEPQDLYVSIRRSCRPLWHRSPARAYCIDIGVSSWEALWARFEGDNENLRILRDWAPIYRRDSWREALMRHGIHDDEFALELAETFPVHRRKLHIVYDDVRPTLDHFCKRFRLGLLTNGAPDLQREKIAGAGIGGYFDEIVVSGDLGFGKPDPRIYRITLSRLGAAADETIMIGNSLHSDIQGAQRAGVKAVWINRAGATREDGIIPDWEMSGLAELKGLLNH